MKNEKIREALSQNRMYAYELATLLGISEATFGRMMRKELPDEEQKRIVELIERETSK